MESNDRAQEGLVDNWLDAALKQYGEAEPRSGLEGRVLANLRAAKEEVGQRRSWWPALASIAASGVIGAAVFLALGHHGVTNDIATTKSPVINRPQNLTASDRARSMTEMPEVQELRKSALRRQPVHVAEASEPRLEQFPAPRPLSEQEQMLVSYVSKFHQEAVLIAKQQAEIQKQDELEMQPSMSGNPAAQTSD